MMTKTHHHLYMLCSLLLVGHFVLLSSLAQPSVPNVDPCSQSPCQNGGTCTSQSSLDFTCSCASEFTGILCESSTNSSMVLLNVTLNTPITVPTTRCPTEVAASIKWRSSTSLPDPLSGDLVALKPCSFIHPYLRGGVALRICANDIWGDIDFSQCTIRDEIPNAFLLVWLTLNTNDKSRINSKSSAILTQFSQHLNLNTSTSRTSIHTINTLGSTAGVTILVQYRSPSPPPSDVIDGLNVTLRTLPQLDSLGGIALSANGPSGFKGFYKTDTCACQPLEDIIFQGTCPDADVPFGACRCTDSNCTCSEPFYVGNGISCTFDGDGDGYPNVPLAGCDDTTAHLPYCIQDNCPRVFNPSQSILACVAPEGFSGCPLRVDPQWDVVWANTEIGNTDRQRCPNGPGFATRFCSPSGWERPVVTECESYNFQSVRQSIDTIFGARSRPLSDRLNEVSEFSQEILSLTTPGSEFSLLPVDLNTTNSLLDGVVELLEETLITDENVTDIPDQGILDILSNVLQGTNLQGWVDLQEIGAGSQKLLDNAERYALYIADTLNDEDNGTRTVWQRENIVIGFRRSDPSRTQQVTFPESMEDISEYYESIPAQITLPNMLFRARKQMSRRTVPVTSIIFRNMQAALPTDSVNGTMSVASMVLSTQVASRGERIPELQNDPVQLTFNIDKVENATEYRCAYWKFSDPIGSGGWAFDGITMVSNSTTEDGKVIINCTSTHLTSFAVLVDVSGTQGDTGNTTTAELIALQIVSYIGCAVSIACLLVTIVFFLAMGKELFVKVHYFIHLNLAISLCLAYIAFVAGLEPASAYKESCIFVATLLHYLFLASFCWMLCEGIMLYLMLVVVFSKLARRWWAFLLIGYGTPIIPVAVSVGIRYDDYGVEDAQGNLAYCWLSTSKGVIWAFVGPMLLVITINVIFMIIALVTLFRTTRRKSKWTTRKIEASKGKQTTEQKIELFRTLFIASIVLLPILGLTWVLGLFAVNSNTTVFAWLFTIVNSLQGVFIFIFHVVRSDKIWKSKRAMTLRHSASSTFRTTFRSSTVTSNSSTVAGSNTIKKKFHSYASESMTSDTNKVALSSIAEESFAETKPNGVTTFKQSDEMTHHDVNDTTTKTFI